MSVPAKAAEKVQALPVLEPIKKPAKQPDTVMKPEKQPKSDSNKQPKVKDNPQKDAKPDTKPKKEKKLDDAAKKPKKEDKLVTDAKPKKKDTQVAAKTDSNQLRTLTLEDALEATFFANQGKLRMDQMVKNFKVEVVNQEQIAATKTIALHGPQENVSKFVADFVSFKEAKLVHAIVSIDNPDSELVKKACATILNVACEVQAAPNKHTTVHFFGATSILENTASLQKTVASKIASLAVSQPAVSQIILNIPAVCLEYAKQRAVDVAILTGAVITVESKKKQIVATISAKDPVSSQAAQSLQTLLCTFDIALNTVQSSFLQKNDVYFTKKLLDRDLCLVVAQDKATIVGNYSVASAQAEEMTKFLANLTTVVCTCSSEHVANFAVYMINQWQSYAAQKISAVKSANCQVTLVFHPSTSLLDVETLKSTINSIQQEAITVPAPDDNLIAYLKKYLKNSCGADSSEEKQARAFYADTKQLMATVHVVGTGLASVKQLCTEIKLFGDNSQCSVIYYEADALLEQRIKLIQMETLLKKEVSSDVSLSILEDRIIVMCPLKQFVLPVISKVQQVMNTKQQASKSIKQVVDVKPKMSSILVPHLLRSSVDVEALKNKFANRGVTISLVSEKNLQITGEHHEQVASECYDQLFDLNSHVITKLVDGTVPQDKAEKISASTNTLVAVKRATQFLVTTQFNNTPVAVSYGDFVASNYDCVVLPVTNNLHAISLQDALPSLAARCAEAKLLGNFAPGTCVVLDNFAAPKNALTIILAICEESLNNTNVVQNTVQALNQALAMGKKRVCFVNDMANRISCYAMDLLLQQHKNAFTSLHLYCTNMVCSIIMLIMLSIEMRSSTCYLLCANGSLCA